MQYSIQVKGLVMSYWVKEVDSPIMFCGAKNMQRNSWVFFAHRKARKVDHRFLRKGEEREIGNF